MARSGPENAPLDGDAIAAAALLSRARLLLLIAALGWLAYGAQYLIAGRLSGLAHLGVAAVTFAARATLSPRSTRRWIETSVHVGAGASTVGLLALSVFTGQEGSPANWFFAAIPVFAIYTLSFRAMVGWLVVAAVGLVVAHDSALFVHPPSTIVIPSYELLVAQIALAMIFLSATIGARVVSNRQIAMLEERERTVRAQANEIEQQAAALTRARDVAVDASRVKTEFLATMSHEIRTPLNAVIGMATLLADSDLPPERLEQVESIRLSGELLLTLIGDILDLSKIEADKLELEAVPVDVAKCVEQAIEQVAAAARAKSVAVTYALSRDCPALVISDAVRLRQILLNLLSNAVKFTPAGRVEVEVGVQRRGTSHVELAFSVRDTGIGIAPEAKERLFRSFSQLDASTTRTYGGSGLGLAISKKLCELFGGTIEVESTVGKGSTFRFVVPVTIVEAKASEVRAEHLGARVLVISAGSTAASPAASLEPHLERIGLSPIVATLEDAKALLGTVRAVVLDAEDAAEGIKVARELREGHPTVPVLVHTFRRPGSDMGLHDDVAGWIAKPLKVAALLRALDTTLAGGRPSIPNAPSTRAPAVPTTKDAASRSVLVVDDNEMNRRVAVEMVRRLGHPVLAVSSGAEAIEAATAEWFDIVLMDVQMPTLDGFETTSRLREAIPRHRRPWIVGMTANALPGDRERCLAAGMDDYITKPVRFSSLAIALGAPRAEAEPPEEPSSVVDVLDAATLEELRMLDDGESPVLLVSLAASLRTDTPPRLRDLDAAVREGDVATVKRITHLLRGSAGTVGAKRLYLTASKLEALADGATLTGAERLVERLGRDTELALDALDRVIKHDARAASRDD